MTGCCWVLITTFCNIFTGGWGWTREPKHISILGLFGGKKVHLVKVLNCFSLSNPEAARVNLKTTTFRWLWIENPLFIVSARKWFVLAMTDTNYKHFVVFLRLHILTLKSTQVYSSNYLGQFLWKNVAVNTPHTCSCDPESEPKLWRSFLLSVI